MERLTHNQQPPMNRARKPWRSALVAFFSGLLVAGGIGGCIVHRLVKVIYLERNFSAATQAQTTLLCLKAIDAEATNDGARFRDNARQRLFDYLQNVERQKKEKHRLDEMTVETYQAARAYLFPFTFAEKREADFFWNRMLPMSQEFIKRNGLAAADFDTNNIGRYRIEFFEDGRSGCTASLKLKNGYSFSFLSDGTNVEVWAFNDGRTKTYYALDAAPLAEVDAVKALNFQNKLNDKMALGLAKKFFALQGHEEKNFHPAELHQDYWVGKNDVWGNLPFYEITWYRKDVKKEDRQEGIATLPRVIIEVSGIDLHLISYTKAFMPAGKDF